MSGKLISKRIYEDASEDDGYRILCDRLWPRGRSKESVKLDKWLKDIAPSSEIRKEFGHDIEKFPAFRDAYLKELSENKAAEDLLKELPQLLKEKNVTLLFGAKDTQHNNAVILKEWIERNYKIK